MIVYLSFIGIIVLSILFSQIKQDSYVKKTYLIICAIQLGCISAFRYTTEYADFSNYIALFRHYAAYSFDDILFGEGEWGNQLLIKIIYLFSNNEQWYFILTSAFIIISFSVFIYKYSSNVYLSMILFVGLNYYGVSMNIVRQYIAVSICLFAYKYLLEKKIFKHSMLILVASLFHTSALIMLMVYLLVKLKIPNHNVAFLVKYGGGLLCASTIIRYGLNFIYTSYSASASASEGAYGFEQANVLGLVIPILVFIVIFFWRDSIEKINQQNRILMNMAMLNLIFTAISITDMLIIKRIAIYVSVPLLLLLPEITKIKSRTFQQSFIVVSMIILTVFYYAVNGYTDRVDLVDNFNFSVFEWNY